uniref:Dolichol-phosphate mannosyltransferase subunit 3 n=1 Tax=Heligmosomoides polygyrus TaxID=6339 RepID=A0A183F9X8_HELPZ
LVLFTYSLGVFWGYYVYTKLYTPETLKVDEFNDFRDGTIEAVTELRRRVEQLEAVLRNSGMKIPAYVPSASDKKSDSGDKVSAKEQQESSQQPKPRFPRISSLPIDSASSVVLKGEGQCII